MEFTVELSRIYNALPFEILSKDKDEVIMVLNYYIEKGFNSNSAQAATKPARNAERIRVNDKTASGGWF